MLTAISVFAQTVVNSTLDLLFEDTSCLNTKLSGLATQIPQDLAGLAFGWLDMYSFALYMLFLYYFLGPLCMAFSYGFVQLTGTDRRLHKKYHKKNQMKVQICGEQQYIPLFVAPKMSREQMYQ